jgi:hypothetical protein
MAETLFDLPIDPDQFGVVLPDSNLRNVDFSALDYDTSRRVIIEYIRTYYPDDFNDFVASNGIMMLIDIIASTTSKLSIRSDMLANEATLPTAKSERAVINHLALINQRIKRQTPATVDVECTVVSPNFTDINIPAGTRFSTLGLDGSTLYYEIFRAPGDFTSDIIIPANKRGVIAYGVEGTFAGPVTFVSSGNQNQVYTISDTNILEDPMFITVTTDNQTQQWQAIYEPIERYDSTANVVEVNTVNNEAFLRFGDGITGSIPKSGSVIQVRYRVGGGQRGRIATGVIDELKSIVPQAPANTATNIRFRNISPSVGGVNAETIEQAKARAPKDYALQRSIVTATDYAQAAQGFSHPYYGSISKALATLRSSVNANLVELYVLARGIDDQPALPSVGLKQGLKTFLSSLNVLTDQIDVLDGSIKSVDVELIVVMSRNADATVVKASVEAALTEFFDVDNWQLGQALYVSNLIEYIKSIDGIAYVDLVKPLNNILATGKLADPLSDGVGINEIIGLGSRKVSYYYDKIQTTYNRT